MHDHIKYAISTLACRSSTMRAVSRQGAKLLLVSSFSSLHTSEKASKLAWEASGCSEVMLISAQTVFQPRALRMNAALALTILSSSAERAGASSQATAGSRRRSSARLLSNGSAEDSLYGSRRAHTRSRPKAACSRNNSQLEERRRRHAASQASHTQQALATLPECASKACTVLHQGLASRKALCGIELQACQPACMNQFYTPMGMISWCPDG